MSELSFLDIRGNSNGTRQTGLPTPQRIAIGALSGMMPVLVSLAVIKAGPVIDATEVVLHGGRLGSPAQAQAIATLLGLGSTTLALMLVGAISAFVQKQELGRLVLFQASLVAPALLFILIQGAAIAGTTYWTPGDETGAQVMVTGLTPDSGDVVRITVYERSGASPTDCFIMGMRGRGC